MDASLPLGPWLVTRDEIPDPHGLSISLTVNGVKKQDSNTDQIMFRVDGLVSYASIGTTLRPGDIISTGTPEGVGMATNGPYLKDGDVLEAKVERVGVLRNTVKAQR
jgi:2-keto-4-pentenoate hydratase/2-oxohepta-3-ene-1,7-dioic acid hydratase in catechol pathway